MTGPLDDWTTSDLVLGARKGDADAWDALVARFAGRVRAVIRSYRVSGADADDVFQVTWLRLVANLEQIRDPERVGAWLATTAGHECLRIIRRSGRHATPDEGWEETLVSDAADVDSEVLVAEREQALWKAMGEVSAQCQRLLGILASDPAPSYEEVSATLDMAVGSIGPTRRRCLDQLRVQLARITGDAEGSAG